MSMAPSAQKLIIAIDGPSGAGKGTIARALAARLEYRHIDTGAMYRAVAWKALSEGLDVHDESAVASVSDRAVFDLDAGRVVIDGVDVSKAIRTPAIDKGATAVARHPAVRRALVARQQEMGRDGGVVMEGRDIGTAVFPDADMKICMDASPEARAPRRASDPAHTTAGSSALADVATALAERDRNDSTRAASPLAMAPDAIHIETTGAPIESVVEQVMAIVAGKSGRV